jgi:hypothetical protein
MDLRVVDRCGNIYIRKEDIVLLLEKIADAENLHKIPRFSNLLYDLQNLK